MTITDRLKLNPTTSLHIKSELRNWSKEHAYNIQKLTNHLIYIVHAYSFTLKNEGEVSFEYTWCVQPGTYRPPSPQENKGLSSKSNRCKTGSSQGKQSSLASRNSGTKAKQDHHHHQKRPRAGTLDGRSSTNTEALNVGRTSQMAHSVDGRPTSAMTTAYDACSVNDPASGQFWFVVLFFIYIFF